MAKFVLIPGAWLGAWAWKPVVPGLEKEGHQAYPVTLTGMGERVHLATREVGLETAVQDVLNVIKYNEVDEFVLVGHSFAGKVAAVVADREAKRLKKVIYLDSFRPEKMAGPQGRFDPAVEFGALAPGEFAFPLTEETVERIGRDVKGELRTWMMSLATKWPAKMANDPLTVSENYDWGKEAYVFCTMSGDPVDDIIAGKYGKLNGPYKKMEAGHWPMISRPAELAEALVALSR